MFASSDYDPLLSVLNSARERKHMYFQPVTPCSVIHWLHGLRTGLTFLRVDWTPDCRRPAVEKRGLEFRAAAWETDELKRRGLSDEAVADELLAIEIEMWQMHRQIAA